MKHATQNTDERCLRCDTPFSKTKKSEVCNEVDLEYLMYFNAGEPEKPASIRYNRTDNKHFDEQNSGVDGLFYLNMFWGVEFLNEFSCTYMLLGMDGWMNDRPPLLIEHMSAHG